VKQGNKQRSGVKSVWATGRQDLPPIFLYNFFHFYGHAERLHKRTTGEVRSEDDEFELDEKWIRENRV